MCNRWVKVIRSEGALCAEMRPECLGAIGVGESPPTCPLRASDGPGASFSFFIEGVRPEFAEMVMDLVTTVASSYGHEVGGGPVYGEEDAG